MTRPTLWSVTIRASKSDAVHVSDVLEMLLNPEPVSVALHEEGTPDHWSVTAHYIDRPDTILIETHLSEAGLPTDLECERLPDVDWVAKSLEHLSPITTDRFFVAGSHHADDVPAGKLALTIDAGQAFGTGHHETTLGCLMRLEQKLKSRHVNRILDLGTGTGVLALAIAKLSRCPVVASDTDPVAIRVAKENAKTNNLQPLIHFVTATGFDNNLLKQGGPYDLIVANILARPLMKLAPDMQRNTRTGSSIILSGLLASQERMVLSSYISCGFRLKHRLRVGEWSILELCR